MAQSHSLALSERSRLVKLMSELAQLSSSAYDYNLAERLGHFMGVSGSMNLALGLRALPVTASDEASESIDIVRKSVLEARERMIMRIVESFSSSDSQNSVPSLTNGVREEALRTFSPYQRYYTSQQIEMGVAIKALRQQLRHQVSSISLEMHRLASLDEVLEANLEAHVRKQFNAVTKGLEIYFKTEMTKQTGEIELDQFLSPFYQKMRELLLAELDARMQPIFGLLEALNEYE